MVLWYHSKNLKCYHWKISSNFCPVWNKRQKSMLVINVTPNKIDFHGRLWFWGYFHTYRDMSDIRKLVQPDRILRLPICYAIERRASKNYAWKRNIFVWPHAESIKNGVVIYSWTMQSWVKNWNFWSKLYKTSGTATYLKKFLAVFTLNIEIWIKTWPELDPSPYLSTWFVHAP